MKSSDPLLLADVILHRRMYPAGKVDMSRHLAIPGFPQSDHTVALAIPVRTLVHCVMKHRPQVILKCHPPICLDYRSAQTNPALLQEEVLTFRVFKKG